MVCRGGGPGGPGFGYESGQAAVETALVLPLMILTCLGILQLAVMQQAKLLTEYAAFSAARAGIVWSGSNERMRDAAILALLPTREALRGTGDGLWELAPLADAYERFLETDAAFRQLDWGDARADINGVPLQGLVRVDTVNPGGWRGQGAPWKLAGGDDWEELDFDGSDAYPETGDAERLRKLFDLRHVDDGERAYRDATVLSIRLRYWYELRIPFANALIFLAWFAASSEDQRTSSESGLPMLTARERDRLWSLASGGGMPSGSSTARRFFLPLSATYAMRMQSNFHRKWLMHPVAGEKAP